MVLLVMGNVKIVVMPLCYVKEEIKMEVKTTITDAYGVKENLNKIGWEYILQILPDHHYDGTLFVIIYKGSEV